MEFSEMEKSKKLEKSGKTNECIREGNEVNIKEWVGFKKVEEIQKSSHAPDSDHEVSQINLKLSRWTDPMFLCKVNVENV